MIVTELRRFPIKSMLGELLVRAHLGPSGVDGDRAHALVDQASGKVASAKDPKMWAGLLAHRASYIGAAGAGEPVLIETEDGSTWRSDAPDIDERLSALVGRAVRLEMASKPDDVYDDVWPDVDGIAPADFLDAAETGRTTAGQRITALPVGAFAPGTYQDLSPLTVLTTASLRTAAALHPDGDWDPRRFRANLLIEVEGVGFLENEWVGRTLVAGDVVLNVLAPTPRCVMPTLSQEELPPDRGVLRTVAAHNRAELPGAGLFACLGAYATVATPGVIAVGDHIELR